MRLHHRVVACTVTMLLLAVGWPMWTNAAEKKMGGRMMVDWLASASGADVEARFGTLETGTEFRRARMFMEGELTGDVHYKIQMEFAGARITLKDVYIGLETVPGLGRLRVGHQKEPFSLEELTSSKYITFMERALPNVFAPSRNTGLLVQNAVVNRRITWAVGAFREADGSGNSVGAGGWSVTARVTGLPWYRDDGRYLLHVGVAYSRRDPLGNVVRFRERPEVHISPRLVDTGVLDADTVNELGLEAALVAGPISLQGELITASVDILQGKHPRFQGYYVYASVFLTGEHRVYKKSSGAFGRVRPKHSFREGGGIGAWELAVRYSVLDLTDAGIEGGELRNWTVGLNWYLNGHTRVMLNYVRADRTDVGTAHYVMTRFQIDF